MTFFETTPFLLCPLCGKNASLKHLRPDEFDTDIYAQEIEGLDKGKGFRTTGRGSIIHSSEVKNIIVPRLIVLLKLVIEEGVVSPDEVRAKLGLPDVEEAVEVEEDETTALQEEREAADQAVDEVVAQIAEAMGEDPGSYEPGDYGEDDEKIVQLKYWVTRLIDDYTGVKEEIEDNSDSSRDSEA